MPFEELEQTIADIMRVENCGRIKALKMIKKHCDIAISFRQMEILLRNLRKKGFSEKRANEYIKTHYTLV